MAKHHVTLLTEQGYGFKSHLGEKKTTQEALKA